MSTDLAAVVDRVNHSFVESYPREVASALEALPLDEVIEFFERHAEPRAAAVLQALTPDVGQQALERLGEATARRLLPFVDPPAAAVLLARLEPELCETLLGVLPSGIAGEVRALMAYPPDSAGNLMDPRVSTFRADDTAQDVLDRLDAIRGRRVAEVYLVDEDGRLQGAVALQDVALAAPEERLGALSRGMPPHVGATASREEILEEFGTRRVPSLPVVDFERRLVGALRHAALLEAAQEEASADIQTMVGASKDERALSPALFAVRKRLPWLQINLATAFLAAAVVGLFEDTIAKFTALAVLLPVVAGQSGNTGAQALAVTMRGLALREVRSRHWLRVALKEVGAASVNGVAVAVTTALGVFVWSGSPGLTLVIGISMVLSMTLAGLSGALIPMALTAAGQDPAQSSSIILTTVTDVAGFLSFLGIATLLSFLL